MGVESVDQSRLVVIGGGLAGCEAAWQAAERGVPVTLYDMKPGASLAGPRFRRSGRVGLQ